MPRSVKPSARKTHVITIRLDEDTLRLLNNASDYVPGDNTSRRSEFVRRAIYARIRKTNEQRRAG